MDVPTKTGSQQKPVNLLFPICRREVIASQLLSKVIRRSFTERQKTITSVSTLFWFHPICMHSCRLPFSWVQEFPAMYMTPAANLCQDATCNLIRLESWESFIS